MKIIFLFLLLPAVTFGQPSLHIGKNCSVNNFEAAMTVVKPTDSQLDSINMLCGAFHKSNIDSALLIAQRLLILTKNHPDKKYYVRSLIGAGRMYIDFGDNKKAQSVLKEAIPIAESIKDLKQIATINSSLARIASMQGAYEESLAYLIANAKICAQLNDKVREARAYKNISRLFSTLKDYKKSGEYLQRTSQIAEDLDHDNLRWYVAEAEAKSWFQAGKRFYYDNEDSLDVQIRQDTMDYYTEKSEKGYYKALGLAKKLEDKRMTIATLNSLVTITLKLDKPKKAVPLAKEAKKLVKELGDVGLLVQCKFNLAKLYRMLKQYDLATKYGEESLALAKKHGLQKKESMANRQLYDVYKETKSFEKANLLMEEMRDYDAKMTDIDRNKTISKMEAQYQTVKKEKQILELAAANVKMETQRNSILGGGLLLALLGVLSFRFNKIRQDRNDRMAFAEALIVAQEDERKRIARDLHDGIGQSLLLIKKQMENTHQTTQQNQKIIGETLEEVRAISRDLHPFQLDNLGLTAALQEVVFKIEESTDLFITTEIAKDVDTFFSKKEEIHVYRTIQEALNNVVKHAAATAVQLVIGRDENVISIKIQDNGKGYDHELAYIKTKSLGLRTMYERIAVIGGKLKTSQRIPKGTIINITIPKK
ncbi:MAG: signal transduction histidine kinase [Paraglaciecola sp.]|jgi:signal transduction histidine kinase